LAPKAVGSFMLGAVRALEGDMASGLKQMEPTYEATFNYGFLGMLPGVIMAEALAAAGRNREALALVTRLLEGSRTPEAGAFVSELWRIRGELVLRQSAGDARQAEHYLATAARIAAEQGAPVYRLRAGTGLARLLAEEGRRDEARTVLDRTNADPLEEWQGPEIGIATRLRSELG
jgi:ATP/maltotriose-dependent transcriptional regulator MalT